MSKSSPGDRIYDRAGDTGHLIEGTPVGRPSKTLRREILFPTEPSTIGNRKIDRAVERVAARKQ
jgi:hypothetical protein